MPRMPNGFVPMVSAYSGSAPGGVVRAEIAGGPSRVRLDWLRGRQRYAVSIALDKDKLPIWAAFYHRVLRNGSLAFEMRLDTGLGTAPHLVNIVPGTYSLTMSSGKPFAAFTVECESSVYQLTDAQVAAYGLSAAAMPDGFVPVIGQYSINGPAGAMRDGVDGGAAGYALGRDRGPITVNCTLMLPPERFAIWSVWFHRLIAKGARTFSMRLDSGFGPEDHAATIIPGSYSETRTGGTVTVVSFAVEAESKAYDMSVGAAQVMVDAYSDYPDGADAIFARLAQFATVDSNVMDF